MRFAVLIILLSVSTLSFAQDESAPLTLDDNTDANGVSISIHPKKDEGANAEAKPESKPATKRKTVKKKSAAKKKSASSSTAKTSAPAQRDAETSLRYLNNGNTRFIKKNFRADGRTAEDRERGLEGEKPHTAVLASSDSRVVPEIIFDQGLGELYTIRTLGETVDDSVIASLEYAVNKLGVPLIVVLANSDCAAMKLQAQDDESDLSDSLKDVVDAIHPRLKTLKRDSPSPSYEVEATLNADAIARELARKSQVIRKAVDAGKLTIKSALYRINTGRVTFY